LANTIDAKALGDGAVDVDGAAGAVGFITGFDAKDSEVAGGDGPVGILVASAFGNANAESAARATSAGMFPLAVRVTAFAAQGVVSKVALLLERGSDHTISAEEVDAVGGGEGRGDGW